MRHPSEGTLRRLLDEPLSVALRDREHCASCARCQVRLAGMKDDAAMVASSMSVPVLDVDARAALASMRLRTAAQVGPAHADTAVRLPGRLANRLTSGWSRPMRAAAAIATAAVLVGTLAGTGAADALLTIFQPRQVSTVTVTPSDFSALPDLTAYGKVTWTAHPSEHAVTSLATADQQAGEHVLTVASVPDGVAGTPSIHVFPETSGSFAFDPARASAAAAAAGATLPPMPADIAGSTLYGSMGPAVVQVFHATASLGGGTGAGLGAGALPALVVGQTRAPVVSTTGVTFDQLRDYLLAQPGISPSLAAQLRSLGDPAQTLPIPVPAGGTVTKNVTVRGVPGVWIGDQGGLGGGVIWQSGGTIYGVGGIFNEQQILAIADALH